MATQTAATIDDYIAQFPAAVQQQLQAVREAIHREAPEATEKISWQMPTFYLNGNLIHFAAAKAHIGIYPGAEGIETFSSEFTAFGLKFSKGAVQLPLNQPLPLDLIARITRFNVGQRGMPCR
jgi:uncharacterized protein YdhG (YjbR/CyaY superfamily)